MKSKVFIIAEAGVNHNGDLGIAKQMIDAAKEAGADAIKFQTFKADRIVSQQAQKAPYQKQATDCQENQLEMLKRLELAPEGFRDLFRYCKERGILFLSTPFDLESVKFLYDLGMAFFKIPSGEITNLPYLRNIGRLKKKVILSTGMSRMDEVKTAFDILRKEGTAIGDITILHCNTEYPTPYVDVNLQAMISIRDQIRGVHVGYSDHTLGTEVSIAAVALGAEVIEKHFTLDRKMSGPDHKASLEPRELKQMIESIRHIEFVLGDGVKRVSASEAKNRVMIRKSIVAKRLIKKNEIFSSENITAKRPATGLSPMMWDKVIGQKAKQDFQSDDEITL